MTHYSFDTTWRLRAPLPDVWEALVRSDRWPAWWRGLERVDMLSLGDAQGIGARQRLRWRSSLIYTLTFDIEVVRVEPMSLIEGHAHGDLEGIGVWELQAAGDTTSIRYTWRVRTTRPWMKFLAPIARPLFRWSHDRVMRSGAAGLAELLDVELLQA